MSVRTVSFSAVTLVLLSIFAAQAQDVDVQGNLTMHDSSDATVGNILKEGVSFLHNYGAQNTFLGSYAGNLSMTGNNNSGVGYGSLSANTTGSDNIAVGFTALGSNTEGNANTAAGSRALSSNTGGFSNTAIGYQALASNTIGLFNTASGEGALWSNVIGADNTATGLRALYLNNTGSGNTASGEQALFYNTTGSRNTASGFSALVSNTTGSDNTAIGIHADVSASNLTNATAIGAYAIVNASNKIRLGSSFVTVIEGQVPYSYTSDRNEKENFRSIDAEAVLTKLRGMAITSWNYKGQDPKQFRHYGPVAQDFFAAFGRDGVGTIGTPTTITSGDLDGILVIAAQALEKRTEALMAENAELKARLAALESKIANRRPARAK